MSGPIYLGTSFCSPALPNLALRPCRKMVKARGHTVARNLYSSDRFDAVRGVSSVSMNARLTLEEILDQVRRLSEEEQQRLVADLQANAGRTPSEDRRRAAMGRWLARAGTGTRRLTTSRARRAGIWRRSTGRSRETGLRRHQLCFAEDRRARWTGRNLLK